MGTLTKIAFMNRDLDFEQFIILVPSKFQNASSGFIFSKRVKKKAKVGRRERASLSPCTWEEEKRASPSPFTERRRGLRPLFFSFETLR